MIYRKNDTNFYPNEAQGHDQISISMLKNLR